jgi:hypothetical protein
MTEWEEAISRLTGVAVVFDDNGLDSIVDAPSALTIGFHCQAGELTIYSQVGVLDDDSRLRSLLAANCFWRETGGATLSLFDERRIVLARWLAAGSVSDLAVRYADFIAAARRWQADLGATPSAGFGFTGRRA